MYFFLGEPSPKWHRIEARSPAEVWDACLTLAAGAFPTFADQLDVCVARQNAEVVPQVFISHNVSMNVFYRAPPSTTSSTFC